MMEHSYRALFILSSLCVSDVRRAVGRFGLSPRGRMEFVVPLCRTSIAFLDRFYYDYEAAIEYCT
jgi:hypothetical protein